MRRKPNSQGGGYNNQGRKQRYQGGGGDFRGGQNNNRPRKNYPALREKYLAQARDALAAGDRVLAENYYQHADHCYRMMVEEGYNFRNNNTPQVQENAAEAVEPSAETSATEHVAHEEPSISGPGVLPAFITANFEPAKPVDPATVQNWEERDAQ